MQPLISAMTSLREVLVAALKSLFRGKSFIHALLTFWVSPAVLKDQDAKPKEGSIRSITDFLKEAENLFLGPVDGDRLREFSMKLKHQFLEGLRTNPECMLPSYNSQLPDGAESGQYLALDVGGSTLRVALVELKGRQAARGEGCRIVRMDSYKIDKSIRNLQGVAFFDWMAGRIHNTVATDSTQARNPDQPLLMGLAWSFPIDQTSAKGGRLCGMGKGFLAADGLLGQDLGGLIKAACKEKGLHIELSAIVNDSSATLLSEAYTNPTTRFGLILGTGVNIAAHLPVTTIGLPKFGERPQSWHEKASHVIVNTELGMFGKNILPLTHWDKLLKASHPRPEFQPLEHLVSGYYLGEICRLALIEAIDSTGIFGGVVPPSLLTPYSLDTETLSIIEADTSVSFESARKTFASHHPSQHHPGREDIAALRALSSNITRRSAAIVAASLFALWELKAETETELLGTDLPPSPFPSFRKQHKDALESELMLTHTRTMVAYNGSVIEHYPGYRANLQAYVDSLTCPTGTTNIGNGKGSIELRPAKESSLLGAAVALACLEGEEA